MRPLLIACVFLMLGCDNQHSRQELVEWIDKDFKRNRDMYEFITDYFTQLKIR
jgi:hypothetical protein